MLGRRVLLVGTTMHLVVAQRLVRRSCPLHRSVRSPLDDNPRRSAWPSRAARSPRQGLHDVPSDRKPAGVAVYEVVPITPALTKLIEDQCRRELHSTAARKEGHNVRHR